MSDVDVRREPRVAVQVAAVVLLAIAIVAMRAHTYDEPLERDLALYAVFGHELLAGRALYSDLWDHKPPAIYVAYAAAEAITGHAQSAVFLLNVLMSILTLVAVAYAGKRLAGPLAGLVAAGVWTLVSGDLLLQANQPNTEVFLNACIAAAFAILFARSDGAPRRIPRLEALIAAGTLFGLAVLFKHVAVVPALFAAAVCASLSGISRGARVKAAIAMTLPVVALIGATAAWFVSTGRGRVFYDVVVTANAAYAGDLLMNVVAAAAHPFGPRPVLLGTLFLIAVFAVVRLRPIAARLLLIAWLAGTFVAVALPGKAFPHYFQLWLPPLAIASGVAVAELRRSRAVAVLLLIVPIAWCELPAYRLTADQWSVAKYGPVFVEARDVGRTALVRAHRDALYVWGSEPSIYLEAGASPLVGIVNHTPLIDGPFTEPFTSRVLAELKRRPPAVVVINRREERDHEVVRWIRANYRAVGTRCSFEVCLRR